MNDFYKKIKDNLNSSNLDDIIEESSYKFSKDKFHNISIDEKKELVSELFIDFYNDLSSLKQVTKENNKRILRGIKNALIKDDEDYLYELLYKSERIKKELENKGGEMKKLVFHAYKNIEDSIKVSDLENKENILSAINSETVNTIVLKNVINELSENVFVSIIESNENIKETAKEFSKTLTYRIILEENFKKYRVLEISKIIIYKAIEIANLNKLYSYELIEGAVEGVNEGIVKYMEKFKKDFKFAPEELKKDYIEFEREFDDIGKDYIGLLKFLSTISENPAKNDLEEIIKKDYDGYFAKIKRISNDISTQLKEKFDNIDVQENYQELSKFTTEKFEEIKKELNSKKDKIVNEFYLSSKFTTFKKDIEKLEEKLLSKFSEFKEKGIKLSNKELADRAYKATKDKIKEDKESLNNSDKD